MELSPQEPKEGFGAPRYLRELYPRLKLVEEADGK